MKIIEKKQQKKIFLQTQTTTLTRYIYRNFFQMLETPYIFDLFVYYYGKQYPFQLIIYIQQSIY